MAKKKRKPTMSCPHCDGEHLETFAGEYDPGEPFWYVACLDCGAEGPHGDTEDDACKLWDAKHTRHRIGERIAAPAHAKAGHDVAENAAMPASETPGESLVRRMAKRPFFALGS